MQLLCGEGERWRGDGRVAEMEESAKVQGEVWRGVLKCREWEGQINWLQGRLSKGQCTTNLQS